MRTIDADAALKALRRCQTYLYDARDPELKIELSSAEAAINNLPTIQPEKVQLSKEGTTKGTTSDTIQPEPKEGHWIPHESPDGGEQYECSRCGVLWEFTDGTPEDNEAYFCPKCGTKLITK